MRLAETTDHKIVLGQLEQNAGEEPVVALSILPNMRAHEAESVLRFNLHEAADLELILQDVRRQAQVS